jgi:hypothetical protein
MHVFKALTEKKKQAPAPTQQAGSLRTPIWVTILTSFVPVILWCLQEWNKPSPVSTDVVLEREVDRLERDVEDLEDRLLRFEELIYQLRFGMRRSASDYMSFLEAPEPTSNIDDEFADLEHNPYEDLESYWASMETKATEDELAESMANSGLVGWIFIGEWDEASGSWDETNIHAEAYRDPPSKGDVVVISNATELWDSKPSNITLSKGAPIGPGVLFPGSELEIIEVDHSVGFSGYSWAKVRLLFEAN